MKRYALLLFLILPFIHGCGGGAPLGTSSASTGSTSSTSSTAASTSEIIRQCKDGDQVTYSLALTSGGSSAAGTLVATTHVDSGTTPKYGNRSFHISWDIRVPASATSSVYTQDNYYEQDGSGAIYYLGYKAGTVNFVQTQSAFKPLAYPSPLTSYAGAQTSYIAIYADGSQSTVRTTVGYADTKAISGKTACLISTTVDSKPTAESWFSADLGYLAEFPLSFKVGAVQYDGTATLTSTSF